MKLTKNRLTEDYDTAILVELYGEAAHSPLQRTTSQIRHELRRLMVKVPAVYLPLTRWKYPPGVLHRPEALRHDTEIVIEGYPRSGNSFAFTAFDMAQGKGSVRISHHLHTASPVIAAIKAKIPCVILVRNPEDAIISHILYSQNLTIKQCLNSYLDFYQPLLKYKEAFVIAKFEDVISDFGQIIQQTNQKFSTNFKTFEHTQENADKCFEVLNNSWKDLGFSEQKSVTCAPSDQRKRYKEILREHFRADSLSDLRNQALNLYSAYL
ncbi:hypothetical protein S7335_2699 [Synechococcus sp. PCC 7335]|uniref:hypothetical protein n=1 Tax=Synechococcus sp. (strain ATCC 29403 / PCC 7335) TaxID=91464 RepID=UPI00017ED99C|nr:hypothetical protein [Synechococcus sp. PCC 7335]EDX85000.1 hypothetical protein S7335_2699 [Synechococcus sp. PCC 7335]